ncbi:hypothetical protein BZL54_23155 [Burkholderia ubonensis subsp. mesacidophila]|uniref:Toxin co-regulated pilus biosynthesis protein Q C-terminal domain-containing protein n=2 Tax=Burkholderia ubonensis TaxID=101571 RepID=A0A2A4FCB2_9BURK|nr:hypothetical protein BZL54_23155 [Burkholderia ubonensis subsp. mesacidophila]
MHKTTIYAALTAIGIGMASIPIAHAGFVNEAAPQQAQLAAATDNTPDLTASSAVSQEARAKWIQRGMRPSDVAVPRGKGRDIALADMAPVVVPRDFRIDMGTVDGSQLVSWAGGKPWDAVLKDAIDPIPNVEATLDWSKRVVTFRRAAAGRNGVSGMAPVAAPAVAMRWQVLASDVTLRQTLIRWAKDAGWQVSWEIGYDYPVQLEGSFAGTFEEAVGQYMASLRYSDYPALACMYEANHVVRVLHYGDKKECEK